MDPPLKNSAPIHSCFYYVTMCVYIAIQTPTTSDVLFSHPSLSPAIRSSPTLYKPPFLLLLFPFYYCLHSTWDYRWLTLTDGHDIVAESCCIACACKVWQLAELELVPSYVSTVYGTRGLYVGHDAPSHNACRGSCVL